MKTRKIYTCDDYYTPTTMAAEAFDSLLNDRGIAFKSKKALKEQYGEDSKIRRYKVTITFERIPV